MFIPKLCCRGHKATLIASPRDSPLTDNLIHFSGSIWRYYKLLTMMELSCSSNVREIFVHILLVEQKRNRHSKQ